MVLTLAVSFLNFESASQWKNIPVLPDSARDTIRRLKSSILLSTAAGLLSLSDSFYLCLKIIEEEPCEMPFLMKTYRDTSHYLNLAVFVLVVSCVSLLLILSAFLLILSSFMLVFTFQPSLLSFFFAIITARRT